MEGEGHTWVVSNPCCKIGHFRKRKGNRWEHFNNIFNVPINVPNTFGIGNERILLYCDWRERESSYAPTWRCESDSILKHKIMTMHNIE
jgi:hypothetical protein